MSRKKVVHKKRKLALEPKFHNHLLSRFIRHLMWSGKLSTAERIVYKALDIAEQKLNQSGLEIFLQALNNVKPLVKVKARRVGGSTYQIPIEVPEDAGLTLATRWIITAARNKSGAGMEEKLARELLEACEKRGDAFRKREETHKMAEANRAFAHYRV